MNLNNLLLQQYKKSQGESLSIQQWLDLCKTDPSAHDSPAERLLKAIGEPEEVDTSTDPILSRLFHNRIIYRYKAFKDFYGLEETIERFVDYVRHSSQGLEESKQICYFLGPVGGGKSSLVERIKTLMEQEPFWAIEGSPVHDSPLYLFSKEEHGEYLKETYGIPSTKLRYKPSPWLVKRLEESEGDISQLRVIKIYPSKNRQIAISRTEPGDPNNQDISTLVGKIDIRKIESYSQNDADAYLYSGGLSLGNRGCMEFVEMFKAPLPVLNPLLSATQDGCYNGTEAISGIPFEGMIFAHSNESEWELFKNNAVNEAFLDRVYLIRVPYCLRISEEEKIYQKIIQNSELRKAPCAPQTLKILSEFSILTRLANSNGVDLVSKMKIYNGESLKDKDPSAKTLHDYKELAGITEGMKGISTRFTFKVLSKTFNHDLTEIGANPVHLIKVLKEQVKTEQLPQDTEGFYLSLIDKHLKPDYLEFLKKEIQYAYLDTYQEYAQTYHDQYFVHADMWLQDSDYKDPNTGTVLDKEALERELSKIEKAANIHNTRDFRNDFVAFVYRYRSKHDGKMPKWDAYSQFKEVIEKKLMIGMEEIMPVISFGGKKQSQDAKRHRSFVNRMSELGYTERQTRLVVEFYIRERKS